MDNYSWKKSYSVNIKKFDEEHKELINIINELNKAMIHGKAKNQIGNIIGRLVAYIDIHFSSEESYFEKYDYIYKHDHILEHDEFREKIRKFKEEFDMKNPTLSMKVMSYIKTWLIMHINGTDKQYTDFFNKNGVW